MVRVVYDDLLHVRRCESSCLLELKTAEVEDQVSFIFMVHGRVTEASRHIIL